MAKLYSGRLQYEDDMAQACQSIGSIDDLSGKSILITGATGLIGSFLVDLFMYCNQVHFSNIHIYAMSRNIITAKKRFASIWENENFHFLQQSVEEAVKTTFPCDYIIHAASNAHPLVFSQDPVGTMHGNYIGMYNLLEYARINNVKRTLYVSSGEIYGQSSDNVGGFDESYSGLIDSTNPRSCYPIGKRAAETLCACYLKQYGVESVIVRPCHIYGSTQTDSDSRVSAQFIRNVLAGQDIIMKSDGMQVRSYCYIADCAAAIIKILLCGKAGEAYNIADKQSIVSIRELATIIAEASGKKVIMELPDNNEKSGYSTVQRAVLDATKLELLGWRAQVGLSDGFQRVMKIIK